MAEPASKVPPTANAALQVCDVRHQFEDGFELRDLCASVAHAELVCLLGPSGCGKTTLLRLIAGLERLQRGEIWIGPRVVANRTMSLPPEQRGVGLMFQDYALFPHMNVADNICYGVSRSNQRARAQALQGLADMGLAQLADRFPHTLSGGQQQRIALLRALAPGPGIMLLDEPFSGLDEHLRQQVRQETRALLQRTGTASLIVTHDPEEAMYLGDRLMVMDEGRIIQVAAPLEVFHQPLNAYVARLFGPVTTLSGHVQAGQCLTALGRFDAPEISDGEAVEVIVRAAGIHIEPLGDSGCGDAQLAIGRVVSARPLGLSTQVLVDLPAFGPQQAPVTVEVRQNGVASLSAGTQVKLTTQDSAVFVFAR